jgi:hypothetical protein
MENEQEREKLVKREVLCDASQLIQELMGQDKYFDDLGGLLGEEDEDGNMPEVFEYWLVTPWLGEKLKAHGELVTEDFFNLVIWGRQTTGQLIYADGVIGNITKKILTK